MKIWEVLKIASESHKLIKMTRDNWSYYLQFDPLSGNLELVNSGGTLTAYVLSVYDFNYEWQIRGL